MKRVSVVVTALLCATGLAACGGGGSKAASSTDTTLSGLGVGASSTTGLAGVTTSTSGEQTTPIGRIRVANLITVNGAPGPAMDVYDHNRPAAGVVPLIQNLGYGQISDYVTPHGFGPGAVMSNLYVYPAGSTQPAPSGPLTGLNVDQSGFEAGDQLTLGLMATTGGLGGFGVTTIAEAGKRIPSGIATTPPAGKGLLIVESAIPGTGVPLEYLTVDGACAGTSATGSVLGNGAPGTLFAVAPGPHRLGVITSPAGYGLTTCTGATRPGGAATVNVSAGGRIAVFAYGSPAAPTLASAPVG